MQTQEIKFWITRGLDFVILSQGRKPIVDGRINFDSSVYVARFRESLFRKKTEIEIEEGEVVELLSVKLEIRRLKKT